MGTGLPKATGIQNREDPENTNFGSEAVSLKVEDPGFRHGCHSCNTIGSSGKTSRQHQHGDQSEGFVITDPVVHEFSSSAFRIDL